MRLILIKMARFSRTSFWRDAATIDDSATPKVLPGVLLFGLISVLVAVVEHYTVLRVTIDITSFEFGGAVIGLLLVLRTNEGNGRWYEARKFWGGIVNQCRNIATASLAHGPADPAWRRASVRWTIAFAHACRRSLRNERDIPEIAALVGDDEAARLANADHMPGYVSLIQGRILRLAVDRLAMSPEAFFQTEAQRLLLIDHIGGCERISKTPLPRAYSIQIRRFMFLFLATLPLGLIPKIGEWATPFITMLVAYPLLSLDRIGAELQQPFLTSSLNHLDLDGITDTIERNLLALLDDEPGMTEVETFLVAIDDGPIPPVDGRTAATAAATSASASASA